MTDIDRNDMVVLGRDECIRRLGTRGVGRVAFVVDGLPVIFPVNYAVRAGHIFFLSAPGSKLQAAGDGAVMAFEVDRVNGVERGGWSVVVSGTSSVVPNPENEPLWRLKLGRWAGGGPEILIRIEMSEVSGREIGRPGVRGWIPASMRRGRAPLTLLPHRAIRR